MSHFGQKPLAMEAGIRNKADLGSCWGRLHARESSTTSQPCGGSHHSFLSHAQGCHRLVAPGLERRKEIESDCGKERVEEEEKKKKKKRGGGDCPCVKSPLGAFSNFLKFHF